MLMHVDGFMYRLLAAWMGVIYAGVLWLLGCLLVVTAPASTFALFAAVRRVVEGDGSPSARSFAQDVANNFWPAARVGLVVAAGWLVAAWSLLSPLPSGGLGVVVAIVSFPVLVLWTMATVWVFPILEQRRGGADDAFRVAYMRSLRRPMHAIAAIASAALVLASPFLVPPEIVVPFLLTSLGGCALVITVLTKMAAPPADLRAGSDSTTPRGVTTATPLYR